MSDLRFDDVRLARWLYAREFPPETRAQLDAFHAVPIHADSVASHDRPIKAELTPCGSEARYWRLQIIA